RRRDDQVRQWQSGRHPGTNADTCPYTKANADTCSDAYPDTESSANSSACSCPKPDACPG
ncbi:MAG: hypothetical protein WBM66_00290, partial [Thiothrix litoralis]